MKETYKFKSSLRENLLSWILDKGNRSYTRIFLTPEVCKEMVEEIIVIIGKSLSEDQSGLSIIAEEYENESANLKEMARAYKDTAKIAELVKDLIN